MKAYGTGAEKLKVEDSSCCLHSTRTVNLGVRRKEWQLGKKIKTNFLKTFWLIACMAEK